MKINVNLHSYTKFRVNIANSWLVMMKTDNAMIKQQYKSK